MAEAVAGGEVAPAHGEGLEGAPFAVVEPLQVDEGSGAREAWAAEASADAYAAAEVHELRAGFDGDGGANADLCVGGPGGLGVADVGAVGEAEGAGRPGGDVVAEAALRVGAGAARGL